MFAILAALIFVLHRALGGDPSAGERTVVVSARYLEGRLAEQRARGAETDLETIEAAWIREEVLVREARRLRLDEGDPIVRRRLASKMELLLEASADVPEPTETELRAALAANERYHAPARVRFEHVFFASHRADAIADARAALPSPAPDLGDPFPLGRAIGPRTARELAGQFGPAFASAVEEAPLGEWTGPVESGFGAHLVRVTERRPGTTPAVDTVRDRVRADLLRERREAARERAIEALIADHQLVRSDPSE